MSKLKPQNCTENDITTIEEKAPGVERQGDDVETLESEDDTDNDSLILVLLSSLLLLITASFHNLVMWIFRSLKRIMKWNNFKRGAAKIALSEMETAKTYQQWTQAAVKYDNATGKNHWKQQKESDLYDYRLIEHRLNNFRRLAHQNDIYSLMAAIQESMVRNLGGITNRELYETSTFGTKDLISDYTSEMVRQLHFVCDANIEGFTPQKKFDFFYELRQSYGRSALLLSGGGSLGMYHIGVMKALAEVQLIPKIVSGASVGSIAASFLCVTRDEDLHELFESRRWNLDVFEHSGSIRRKLVRLLRKGVLMDSKKLQAWLRKNFGDTTFKEAYQKTGRILNIAVSSTESYEIPRLLNYLTAPNVLIWSAVTASCALPFVFQPVELLCKNKKGNFVPFHPPGQKWVDGSVGADLPMTRLSELFNVNHFIVSQVNPHVAPFVYVNESKRGFFSAFIYLLKSELKHRVMQAAELGLIPAYINRFQPIVTQKYSGNVTIVPRMTMSDFSKILSNPSDETMVEYMDKGSRSTWPKISYIKHTCTIEFTLEKILTKLRYQMGEYDRIL